MPRILRLRDYPEHWEADVLLRDGRTAHLRPILPEDAEAGWWSSTRQVSEQSKYFRFFAPMPTLSDRDVQRFTNVDYHDRVAFVMTVAGRRSSRSAATTSWSKGQAEVAFLVQDAHQGRGIAQLLLEHLAQAGRERGVDRFVAEVLPDNRRMMQVFREQGYQVKGGWDEGVMHLEFDIDPTETSIGVIAAREHRSEAASIAAFLNASSVAVIGASRRSDTIGALLVRNLVLGDYAGRIYVVNPAADSVAGMPAYRTVGDIPGEVDVAIVAVPAESVQDVVLDCAAKGVHGLIVISSGFAETGEEGRKRQRKLVGLARSYGLRLIGPNCLGVINTADEVSLNASLAPLMPPRGRAGFFCQSGALGTAILEKVRGRGLGLSTFVSAGNRADVSGNDLLQYWEEDDATEVILLYLESIGNPRKFSRIARRVSRAKPIIAVRSGRTTQGVPMGHAVRQIAAPPEAVDAMFRQAGIIQVDTPRRDVRRRPAARPPAAAERLPGRDRRQLRRARAARRRRRGVATGSRSPARPPSAPTRRPRTSRTRSTRRSTTSTSTRWSRSTSRRSTPAAPRSPTCSPRWGSSPTSRWSPRSSAARASPSCCGSPTSPGTPPGAARSPPTPRSRRPCGRSPPVVEYAAWLQRHDESVGVLDGLDMDAAKRLVNELLIDHPDGRDLTGDELGDAARRATASSCGTGSRSPRSTRRSRPASGSAGTSCSRRPRSGCASVPTSPTCGATSTTRRRCATPGAR